MGLGMSPTIGPWGVARIWDPHRAYQQIAAWIGNQAHSEVEGLGGDDAHLAAQKGFDRYSFRRDPGRRRHRSRRDAGQARAERQEIWDPDFAREMPRFVSRVRSMFTAEEITTHLARIEQGCQEAAVTDVEADDLDYEDPATLEERAQQFELVMELLTAPTLGTS